MAFLRLPRTLESLGSSERAVHPGVKSNHKRGKSAMDLVYHVAK
jgi:hypothetical protein